MDVQRKMKVKDSLRNISFSSILTQEQKRMACILIQCDPFIAFYSRHLVEVDYPSNFTSYLIQKLKFSTLLLLLSNSNHELRKPIPHWEAWKTRLFGILAFATVTQVPKPACYVVFVGL